MPTFDVVFGLIGRRSFVPPLKRQFVVNEHSREVAYDVLIEQIMKEIRFYCVARELSVALYASGAGEAKTKGALLARFTWREL